MMISSCSGVLQTDRQTNRRTDICKCGVAFAAENPFFLCVPTLQCNVEVLKDDLLLA